MKVSNEGDGEFFSFVEGNWYEIAPGDSIQVEDYNVAMQLVAAGATVAKDERDALLTGAADEARAENSKSASASASEGVILNQQSQQTVDPATGAVTAGDPPAADAPDPADLKGAELDKALEDRGLSKTGTADEKRERVANHDAAAAELAGQSAPPAGDGQPVTNDQGVELS